MTTQKTKDNLLIKAAEHGVVPLVKELLAEGANVHAWDDYALKWASRYGHTEVVTILKNHIAKKKTKVSC